MVEEAQAWLVHFQFNVTRLMLNIEDKTEIVFASEDEGPVIGLQMIYCHGVFTEICSSSVEGAHLISDSYFSGN